MIQVEIRETGAGQDGYHTVETLQVDDDGTWTITGARQVLDTRIVIPLRRDGVTQRITLQEHPATWARRLPGILRSGYVVAVVTRDDGRPPDAYPRQSRLITRSEAAAAAAVAPDTWSAYVTRGQAPAPVQRIGRTPLWDREDVQRWMAARTRAKAQTNRRDPQ